MLRRLVVAVCAASAVLCTVATSAAVASTASRVPCRPGAGSPACRVWTGKVSWVADGDTPLVDVYGDGTRTPKSIRVIGIQTMEQSVYSPTPSRRRGECHALA